MPDALLTSLSAMSAQQRAMEVTSHNIANAATPGYTRQRVELQAKNPEDLKPGQMGRGVDLTAIRRVVDDLVGQRLRQAEGESGRLDTLKSNLEVVQQAFNEPGENGLSAVIGAMYSAIEDLSNNPESAAARSSTVAAITTWTGAVADLGLRLQEIRDDLQVSVDGAIGQVNALSGSIVRLNQQIRTQIAMGNSPNDLMDQRDTRLGELGRLVDGRVVFDPRTKAATVLVNGQMLIGPDVGVTLRSSEDAEGNLSFVSDLGASMAIAGGSLGALADLHRNVVPGVAGQLDDLVSTVAREMNARQATGTSNSMRTGLWSGDRVLSGLDATLDLDAADLEPSSPGQPGIPEAFAPSFTDAGGAATTRNLTINVLDTTTGQAAKYTIRYDPAVGSGTRSLADLASAINTGRGGGFSLFPPLAGIPGVRATLASADGGVRFQIRADAPTQSLDFSAALDVAPGATAWTGTGAVAVSGTALPALGIERVGIEVNASGTGLDVISRNPVTGGSTILGSVAIPGVGANTAVINGLTITADAGTYRAGDRFAVALTPGTGAVLDPATGLAGPHIQAATWSSGNPVLAIKGRYGNTLSDPALGWSMRVVSAGVVGAKAGTAAPANPPVVEFTVWTGTPSSPIQQKIVKTLDDSLRAGQPIILVDGVYATVGAGTFTTAGQQVSFGVDGDPDQAGLLPALGINQMLRCDGTAASLELDQALVDDPTRMATGTTRNEGDNSNVLRQLDLRKQAVFGTSGSFRFEDAYLGIISDVGVRVDETGRLGENQDSLKASLQHQRDSVSGISIDDEVGALILQQQAYGAAAKMVSAARENIQTLLDILR